jgi:hypothetical protein
MLDFLKPRHLRYHSVEEWRDREKITSFRHPGKPSLEVRLSRQLQELRSHLWKRHLRDLTSDERKQIKTGKHPSQSHKRIDDAKAIFEEFRSRLAGLAYVAEVTMVARQMEHTILRVKLGQDVGWRVWQEHIPPYYRGFEVHVVFAKQERPALTQENAATLIPNGMSESDVYAHLGTTPTITLGSGGRKSLTYPFHFIPAPPKVDPKIDAITVIIANGVVVDRQFGK